MSEFAIIPSIIWKTSLRETEIFQFDDIKIGPTVRFMGINFRLVLYYDWGFRQGNTFRLTFEKLNLDYQPDICFDVQTGIYSDGARSMTCSTTASIVYNVWHLCSEKMSNVINTLDITAGDSILFWIIIKPRNGSEVLSESNAAVKDDSSNCITHLTQDFGKLFDVKAHSDVVLKCGDRSISAHKVILSARSNYFAKLFRNKINKSEDNVVDVKETDPATLEELVYYLYTGEITDFRMGSLRKLYALADRYEVEALKIKCTFSVMNRYSSMNYGDAVNTSIDSFVESLAENAALLEGGDDEKGSTFKGETTDGTSEFGEDTAVGSHFVEDNTKIGQLGGDNVGCSQLEEDNAGGSKMGGNVERHLNGYDDDNDDDDDVVSQMGAKDKTLLTNLFRSREWQTLSNENVKLAHNMCKFLFFQ